MLGSRPGGETFERASDGTYLLTLPTLKEPYIVPGYEPIPVVLAVAEFVRRVVAVGRATQYRIIAYVAITICGTICQAFEPALAMELTARFNQTHLR